MIPYHREYAESSCCTTSYYFFFHTIRYTMRFCHYLCSFPHSKTESSRTMDGAATSRRGKNRCVLAIQQTTSTRPRRQSVAALFRIVNNCFKRLECKIESGPSDRIDEIMQWAYTFRFIDGGGCLALVSTVTITSFQIFRAI